MNQGPSAHQILAEESKKRPLFLEPVVVAWAGDFQDTLRKYIINIAMNPQPEGKKPN